MQKNEGQAPIERVVTERRKGAKKKKKYWSFRGNWILSVPQSGACRGSAERWPNSPLKVRRRRGHTVSPRKLVWVWGKINWPKAERDGSSLWEPHPFSPVKRSKSIAAFPFMGN